MNRQPEYLGIDGVLEPGIIDFGDGVAGAENDVDKVFPRVSLGEPARLSDLRAVPSGREDLEDTLTVLGSCEDIEVFRMPYDAGVTGQGISPAHEKRYLRLLECAEGRAVKIIQPRLQVLLGRRVC